MGGYGSGRSGWRPVVEDGLKLDAYRLQRDGTLCSKGMGICFGSLVWTNKVTGKKCASVSFTVNYGDGSFKLYYTKTVCGEEHSVNDLIWLRLQKTNFNGSRFLFECPRCMRRSAKLYLPSGAVHFRCRRCYNLTYQSSNDSRKSDRLMRLIAARCGVRPSDVKRALRPRKSQDTTDSQAHLTLAEPKGIFRPQNSTMASSTIEPPPFDSVIAIPF